MTKILTGGKSKLMESKKKKFLKLINTHTGTHTNLVLKCKLLRHFHPHCFKQIQTKQRTTLQLRLSPDLKIA